MLGGELDEDVFEAGSERTNLGDSNAVLQELVAKVIQIESVIDERMDGLSENGGAANAGKLAGETQRAGNFGRGDFHAISAMRLDVREFPQRVRRAVAERASLRHRFGQRWRDLVLRIDRREARPRG